MQLAIYCLRLCRHRSVGLLVLARGLSLRSTPAFSLCLKMMILSIFSEDTVCRLYFRLVVNESAMREMGGPSRCPVTDVRGTIVVPCLSLAGCSLPQNQGQASVDESLSIHNRIDLFHQMILNDIVF